MRWRKELVQHLSMVGAVRSQVFENRELSRSAKMPVYKVMIESTLMYSMVQNLGL